VGTATVRWIGGQTYVGIDSTQHLVTISTPAEGVGVKPSDLLLLAMGACPSVDVVEILRKKKITLSLLEVTVTSEQDADPPWTFRKFHLHFRLKGEGLTPKAAEQALHLAEEKYCSVSSTVKPTAQVSLSYEIIES